MIVVMALLVFVGTLFFGSVTIRTAVPLYALTLLLGLLWAVKLFFAEAVSWKKNLMHIPVAAFAFYAFLRYCASPIEYESRLELFVIAVCTLVYFAAACNFYQRSARTVLFFAVLALGLGEAVFGVWQYLVHAESIFGLSRADYYFDRAGGTFFCPNHLAGFLEMAICLVAARLALYASSRQNIEKLALEKIILVFAAAIMIIGLLATNSRGGWFSLLVGLAFLLPLGGKRWRIWASTTAVIAGLGLLGLLAVKSETLNPRIIYTYLQMHRAGDKAVNLGADTLGPRIQIWQSTLPIIRQHPLWGTGGATWQWLYPKYRPDNMPGNPEYVHNDYLNLLSDYGLAGFALVGLAITCFLGHAYGVSRGENSSEERAFAVGSAMAVSAILVHSLFDFNLHIPSNAVLFMALMGCTVAIDIKPDRPQRVILPPLVRRTLALGLILACATAGFFMGRTALAYQYWTLGDYARSSLQDDEAIAYYKKAIGLRANNPYPYAGIADIYLNQSFWRNIGSHKDERIPLARQALAWYEKALATNPYYGNALMQMARAYDIIGDKEQVINTCRRVIQIDPINPAIYSYLGNFYLRQNETELGKAALQKAVDYNYGYNYDGPHLRLQELRSSTTNKVQ